MWEGRYRRSNDINETKSEDASKEGYDCGEKSDHTRHFRGFDEMWVLSEIVFKVTTDGFSDDKREGSFRENSKTSCFPKESVDYRCCYCSVKTIDRLNFRQRTAQYKSGLFQRRGDTLRKRETWGLRYWPKSILRINLPRYTALSRSAFC